MIEKYLNNRFLTLYILPFIIGSITVFSFQPFNFSVINFFVLPILFYLLVFIKKKSRSVYIKKPYKKNLFIFGTVFGFGFYLSGIHWIINSLTFDENLKVLIPAALIFIPLFLSLFFSLGILSIGPFLSPNLSSIFLFSGLLSFSDFIRAKILTGFPWNLWAYSFSWSTEFIQILNSIGLFSFNLICITIFTLPAVLFFNFTSKKLFLVIFFYFCLFLTFYIYGNYITNQNQKYLNSINEKFYIKVISPNFKLEYNLSETDIENRLKKLVRYSEPKKNLKTLFIWPEGVFSGYSFEEIKFLKDSFKKNFSNQHYILFGINRLNNSKEGFFNSLVITDNNLQIIQEYKKQKLVPFGEFLPFEKKLEKIGLKKISEGYGSFLKAGKQENIKIDKLNILPLICYEIIFTKFIQQSNKKTNLIINISEDGWFGNSVGPYQHFAKAVFRSVENDTFLVRSTNKGISAIINNKGEVIKKLNPTEAGSIDHEIPLVNSRNKSRNDLIFFILLFTYILIFKFYKR